MENQTKKSQGMFIHHPYIIPPTRNEVTTKFFLATSENEVIDQLDVSSGIVALDGKNNLNNFSLLVFWREL